jgi:steroid delta-isomerase-like uncharacterized protein
MSLEETRAIMEAYWGGQGSDLVAEDAVYTLMASGEEIHGREAIGELLRNFYTVAFDGAFDSANEIVGDGHAVIEGHLVGKHVGEYAGLPPTGKQVRVPMCIAYDVMDGKVRRARIYMQMGILMEQLGSGGYFSR